MQGVGFRWFTEREARAHDVRGYVRNLPDGTVEVLAQADASTLETFFARLRKGPRASRVDDVERRPVAVDAALATFEVRF